MLLQTIEISAFCIGFMLGCDNVKTTLQHPTSNLLKGMFSASCSIYTALIINELLPQQIRPLFALGLTSLAGYYLIDKFYPKLIGNDNVIITSGGGNISIGRQ